ncbi:replication initiation protein [Clostridium porci]|uniref:Replication initiation protein n=1 Tax=Clostridium porci TaxID=2605778 RepID=A0A7X2TCV4_9CLOT|nr:replication initiation protein [Clostridium porci]MSS36533.1 replication initiation protein [Clostridium porci]
MSRHSTSKNTKSTNHTEKEYKLFEANDVAKFGLCYATGSLLGPISYKALMYLIWKCNVMTPGVFDTVSLSVTEMTNALGYQPDEHRNFSHRAKYICQALKDIMAKPLQIHDAEANKYMAYALLQYVEADFNEDTIKAQFSNVLVDHFGQDLKENFTVVRLKYLNRLDTTAGVLLYPFFCRYQKMQTFSYKVTELAKLITQNESYEYKKLKSKHLLPAIEAINAMTDIHVEWQEKKNGRKVESILFTISQEPADDEKECFLAYNRLKPSEYHMMPYNTDWMNAYWYDMGAKTYKPIEAVEEG